MSMVDVTLWLVEMSVAATLISGSDAVAGSGIGGTNPFTRVSVEAKPALY